MINNIELIKPLLHFEDAGDFYMLYIFKRKKDQTTDKANHQSVRTIKTYCIESLEYLEEKYDEIITLSEMFKARVYIHISKQNHRDISLDMMMELARRIKENCYHQNHLFDSVVGQVKRLEKRWIIDVDNDLHEDIDYYTDSLIYYINHYCAPLDTEKLITKIPTRNGLHLITSPFNLQQLTEFWKLKMPDIQKINPTLLYYPKSLE